MSMFENLMITKGLCIRAIPLWIDEPNGRREPKNAGKFMVTRAKHTMQDVRFGNGYNLYGEEGNLYFDDLQAVIDYVTKDDGKVN